MDRFRMLPNYQYHDDDTGILETQYKKEIRDYQIDGNSIQDGTPSPDNPIEIQSVGEKTANLFDINSIKNMVNSGGGNWNSYMKNENGILTNNMADYGGYSGYVVSMQLEKGLYCLSLDARYVETPGAFSITYNFNATVSQWFSTSLEWKRIFYIFELTEDTEITTWNFVPNGGKDNYLKRQAQFTNIMLSKIDNADEQPEFEPQGKYKIPIEVSGKNLVNEKTIDYNSTTNGKRGCIKWDNLNKINVSGFPYGVFYFLDEPIKAGTQVSMTFNYKSGFVTGGGELTIGAFSSKETGWAGTDSKITINQNVDLSETSQSKVFTLNRDLDSIYCFSYGSMQVDTPIEFNIQVEISPEPTPYEPYREPQTYNIFLDEPLRKIGDYSDCIDFKNNKVIRYIRTLSVKSGTSCIRQTIESTGVSYFQLNGLNTGWRGIILSPIYKNASIYAFLYNKNPINNTIAIGSPGSWDSIMTIRDDRFADVASFEEGIKDIKFYAANRTSIETVIELPKIQLNKGTNIIKVKTATEPSEVNWQYYK